MKSLDPSIKRWGLLAGPVALALALNLQGHAQQPAWQRISDRLRPDPSVGSAAGSASPVSAPAETAPAAPATEPAVESGATTPVESVPDLAVEGAEGEAAGTAVGLAGGGSESTIFLGKESDPDPGAPDLFSGDKFKQYLGENPRFVYDALALPDPMIFPPVRNAAKYQELTSQIAELLASSNYNTWQEGWQGGKDEGEIDVAKVREARDLWGRILDMNDARFNQLADRGRAELDAGIREYVRVKGMEPTPGPDPLVTPTPAPAELPEEVAVNTQGLIAHATDPLALVGDLLIRRGEEVPGYQGVVVEDVQPGIVIYRVTTSEGLTDTFPVEVRTVEERTDVGLTAQQLGRGAPRRGPRRR